MTFAKNAESSRCQDANPPLTQKRKKIIQQFLKEQKIPLENPFVKEAYSHPAVDEQAFCRLFNKQTGKCSVHPVKPETCVAGPITFDINFKTGKIEWFLKKSEICRFAGVLYSDQTSFQRHLQAAKKELTQLICELEPDELRAIVKIAEPQTFKVGEDNLPEKAAVKLGLKV